MNVKSRIRREKKGNTVLFGIGEDHVIDEIEKVLIAIIDVPMNRE